MEDHRIPKQLLFGELEQGHRRQGRPCKRFKDTVKAGLKWCGIPPTELVATALDRQRWRTLTQSASSALEKEHCHQAQSARERRHLAASIPATNANFQCPVCARLCKSRIGLQSHSRTHRLEAQITSSWRPRDHHEMESTREAKERKIPNQMEVTH